MQNNKDIIFSFAGYLTPIKFVNITFPQCNIYTGVQVGCVAFTPLDSYLNIFARMLVTYVVYYIKIKRKS